ncbi:MAG: hypothetical protein NUW01_16175 [Gemmatimonadaceae bacterium]|nr:hypothetical protein [Gemmatimonadaceae bacterium]
MTDGIREVLAHHADCDGWRLDHRVEVVTNSIGAFSAICVECGKLHPGSFGKGARDAAEAFVRAHPKWVPCDGRCTRWAA